MAYVYIHLRSDKNEPFYVGIGNDVGGSYRRANNFVERNPFWHNVYAKTKIKVDIIKDNISYEEAKRLEIYYIALYKRRCDGGPLTNITLGGDGSVGVPRPHLVKWNKSRPWLGKKHTKKSLLKMSKAQRKIKQETNNPNYKGPTYAIKDNRIIGIYAQAKDLATDLKKSVDTARRYARRGKVIKGILYTRNDPGRIIKNTA